MDLPVRGYDSKRHFLFNPMAFFGRRLIFAMNVIMLSHNLWGQLTIQMVISLGILAYLLHYKPMVGRFINCLMILNECVDLLIIILLMCFSEVVSDAKTRYDIGFAYIGLSLGNIAVNLLILIVSSLKKIKLSALKCCNKRKYDNIKKLELEQKIEKAQANQALPDERQLKVKQSSTF